MPRVENKGPSVDTWAQQAKIGPTTHELCRLCYGLLTDNPQALNAFLSPLKMHPEAGPEPRGEDGWGGDLEHPSYAILPGTYIAFPTCAACGVMLMEEDDHA